ncbi:amine sulfotransferase-like isoform X2 [Hyla sarda]|nr:amine sulfotransferase-like isoform X2 [Hyla sarda]XP_056422376.1 amine sulfotransferase-like isoform X2 [Hyla sarda]XP_056422377.1 amine sulfotransferase-like isoform X2 [Hyla sarda]
MDRMALEEALNYFCYKHKGIYFESSVTSPEVIDAIEHMEIRDGDVFLVTFPKSGTVWTQQILSLIFNEGHRNGTEQIENLDRMPWIEYNLNSKNVDVTSRPSPRLFTSHLPHYLMPRDLKFRMGKIIYVCRNPKDVLVSFYYLYKMFSNLKSTVNWETFIELFISGRVLGGSWFDHVRGWYTHKEDFNILFVTFEEMKKDLRSAVKKICTFVGVNLDEREIDTVVEKATFKNMKDDPLSNYTFLSEDLVDRNKGNFLRKGIVGDWKNMMTVAQSEMFDKVYKEKMGDLPIKFSWDLNEETAS